MKKNEEIEQLRAKLCEFDLLNIELVKLKGENEQYDAKFKQLFTDLSKLNELMDKKNDKISKLKN